MFILREMREAGEEQMLARHRCASILVDGCMVLSDTQQLIKQVGKSMLSQAEGC